MNTSSLIFLLDWIILRHHFNSLAAFCSWCPWLSGRPQSGGVCLARFTAQWCLFKPVRALLSSQHPTSIGMCSICPIHAKRPIQVSHQLNAGSARRRVKMWNTCLFWHFLTLVGGFFFKKNRLFMLSTRFPNNQDQIQPLKLVNYSLMEDRLSWKRKPETLFFFFCPCGRRSSKLCQRVRMQGGCLVPSEVVALMRVMTCKRAGKHSW